MLVLLLVLDQTASELSSRMRTALSSLATLCLVLLHYALRTGSNMYTQEAASSRTVSSDAAIGPAPACPHSSFNRSIVLRLFGGFRPVQGNSKTSKQHCKLECTLASLAFGAMPGRCCFLRVTHASLRCTGGSVGPGTATTPDSLERNPRSQTS